MTKSIDIITSVPLTEPVVRNRLFPFFEMLLVHGFRVRCICPQSEFNAKQLPSGVTLEPVDIDFVKPSSFVKRALKEAKDVARLLNHAKGLSSDVVLVTLPSMFLGFLSPIYLRKKSVVMDVRDLSWEYLSDDSFVQRLAKQFFRFCFKRSLNFFKLVSATNSTEIDYLSSMNSKLSPLHISNGIRKEQFNELKTIKPSQEQNFTVSYIGNIGLAQDLSTLVKAAKNLPAVQFNIVGTGIDEPRIKALVETYKLQNIKLSGRVAWHEVLKYYNSSHILYAQLAPEYAGAMPSKLYEYLSTGKPIVYGGQGQAEKTLKEFENCTVVPPCDPTVLMNCLSHLQETSEKLELSEVNKAKINENYIREDAAERLAEHIDLLIKKANDL